MSGDNTTVRYVLRNEGTKPLIVIGVNPSTANETKPDRTMVKVMGFAERNGFDSFIMLNLYPQRTPRPNELHKERNEELHQRNLKEIYEAVKDIPNPSILLAYGDCIGWRGYLRDCLKDIIKVLLPLHPQWLHAGELTRNGNPRHLLINTYNTFETFNIDILLK